MIQLTQWNSVEIKTTQRIAYCKNCMFERDSIEMGKYRFNKGEKRIVVSMSFGPATRHVSLCLDCALHEADQLAKLANNIRLNVSIIKDESIIFKERKRLSEARTLRLIQGGAA